MDFKDFAALTSALAFGVSAYYIYRMSEALVAIALVAADVADRNEPGEV